MKKILLQFLVIFIIGICGGIFAEQILWPYFVERPLFYQYDLEQTPIYVTERKEVTIEENTALQEAIEKVRNSVVGVETQTRIGGLIEGSGLILSSDGLLVTLADLVPQGGDFSFFIQGEQVSFQVLKRDLKDNLALIKVEKENLPTVGFASSEKMKPGQRVFLIGVIFEEGEEKEIVNAGIISSLDKNSIHTNIFENLELKGSPLFNIEGEFLGLNDLDSQGRIYSVPVNRIKTFAGF